MRFYRKYFHIVNNKVNQLKYIDKSMLLKIRSQTKELRNFKNSKNRKEMFIEEVKRHSENSLHAFK